MNRPDELNDAISLIEAQRASLGDAAVDASIAAIHQALVAREQASGAEQRKVATILFADIVDFVGLTEQRDPEDVRELQRAFFTTITAPITEYSGVIEKYIGDAVMAVFGVPVVHEDDAERAVRAALATQAALTALNMALAGTHGAQLAMRVGVHTGTVVATNSTLGSFMVSGDTVNLAFHLQEAAQPNSILVSDATQRLISSACEMEPIGRLQLRRRSELVMAYQVLRTRADAGKLRGVAGLDSPPAHQVEQHGDAWCEAGRIVSNGPYLLERWHPRERVDLVRNPHYHGRFSGNAHRVELLCLPYPTDWRERLALYEAGELDYLFIANWPNEGVAEVERRHLADYRRMPSLHTTSTCFNVRLPPFDDRRVRQAFALAMDIGSSLTKGPIRGSEAVSGGFLPAAMAGYSPAIALGYDPERARALLAEAGFPGGRGFPEVKYYTMMTPGSSAMQQMQVSALEEVLAVTIHLELLEWRDYHRRLEADPPHIGIHTWAANYPDPDDFMRVAYRHIQHYFGWRDEQYESLVEEARALRNQQERLRLYRQADAILVREAAIVPAMNAPTSCLIQPWVERLIISPLSTLSLWTSMCDVVIRLH